MEEESKVCVETCGMADDDDRWERSKGGEENESEGQAAVAAAARATSPNDSREANIIEVERGELGVCCENLAEAHS